MSWQDYVVARTDGPMAAADFAEGRLSADLESQRARGQRLDGAYFGVTDVLAVKPGDVVVVSAATGATGSLVAGICKALGAKTVIGTAGGPEKCRWIVEKAGYDAAIDYKGENLDARLTELCPNGVDAYFDNVGLDTLDTLLLHMAPKGRVVICGAMSSGYTDVDVPGPQKNFMQICVKMLKVQGILLLFYRDRLEEGAKQLARWIMEGRLHVEENIIEGFDKAPGLFSTMFTGKNPGKLMLKIGDPTP